MEPDFVFAFHNLPGYPLHQIVVREGTITAAVRSIGIRLHGVTAHAAEPEFGKNPANSIRAILQLVEDLTNPDPANSAFFLITPVHINMGELAYGVSAGYGEVHLTIRSWTNEVMEGQIEVLLANVVEIAAREGLEINWTWSDVFEANTNDPEALKHIQEAALALGLDLYYKELPIKWGEDFGVFTSKYPGAIIGLGAGENTPALHNPDYDFPDEILDTGIQFWKQLIEVIE